MEVLWRKDYLTLLPAILFLFVLLKYFLRRLTVGGYNHKYVLITGCDTGFGNLLAKQLDSMGFNVFAGCLTEKGISDLQTNSSDRLRAFLLDITKVNDIERAEKMVKKELPPNRGLWALVNNAGIIGPLMFPDCISRDDYKQLMDVNLYGTTDMTNAFLPLLRIAQGRIVNVGSVLGKVSIRLCVPYCVSKFAVTAYSDGLRRAIRSQNISVHLVEPGLFATNLVNTDNILKSSYKIFNEAPQRIQDYYGKRCLEDFLWGVSLMRIADRSLHKVVSCYVHAITARYPKYNYPVGYDAWTFFPAIRLLPTWISDVLLNVEFVAPQGVLKKKHD